MKFVKKRLFRNIFFLIVRRLYIASFWKANRFLKNVKHPHIIEVELTNDCNLKCTHCFRTKTDRTTGYMDFDVFKKLIDEAANYPVAFLRIVGLGESSLHPQFMEFMNYAGGKSIKTELTTNGNIFSFYSPEEILNWDLDILGISVDGYDKKSYEQIRIGGNYDLLVKNIMGLYDMRNNHNKTYPLICIRNVLFPGTNEEAVNSFKEFWRNHSDHILFNTLNTANHKVSMPLITDQRCTEFFYEAHIRFDGSVLLCQHQFIYERNEVIGNISTSKLRQIWKSRRLHEIRILHAKREFPAACRLCFSNTRNPVHYQNSRKLNSAKNKIVNILNKYVNLT